MSKLEQMSQAAVEYGSRWSGYEKRCFENARKFVQDFVGYCEIPQSNLSFLPLNQEPEGKNYPMRAAMHLGDDSWWHLGLFVSLNEEHHVRLELCFSEDGGGKALIRLGPEAAGNKSLHLDFNDVLALHAIFEEIVQQVVQLYAGKPQDPPAHFRKIGFVTEISSPAAIPEETAQRINEVAKKMGE